MMKQDPVDTLAIYLHLARASERRRRPQVRNRLLVLASVAATKAGLLRIAAYCRQMVLDSNTQHLIRRWPTVAVALRDEEFRHFLTHLEKRYSRENAEQLMQSLAIERGHERETYYSDEEYAAGIVGISVEALHDLYPDKADSDQ
jgi:hypothetical protein